MYTENVTSLYVSLLRGMDNRFHKWIALNHATSEGRETPHICNVTGNTI